MFRRLNRRPFVRRLGDPLVPLLIGGLTVLSPNVSLAADLLRSGAATTSTATGAAAPATVLPSATPSLTTAQDRLARTTQALQAVQQMQAAARALAQSGPNNLAANLPAVPLNSYGMPNGLQVAAGVPKDLANPALGENPSLWTGAGLPVATIQGNNGASTSTVTITQNQQQAILNWDSFNIGKSTTLTFDQSAGGANLGQWIAFNFVRDPSGNPTQILGSMKTIGAPDAKGNATVGGQLYVMNVNGIIFGGTSQVNTHGLVASSLPINYNLIQQGVLHNPDAQFLFSALPQAAGSSGPTPAFDPSLAELGGSVPIQTPLAADGAYGDVLVQPGAQLIAPSNADHVGGRIALIGPNVTNAGTISTADGQTILAAGLQVGLAAHNGNDATLRGLDVYVGEIADVSLPNQPPAGVATNAGLTTMNLGISLTGVSAADTNPSKLNPLGLIEAPRGDVYLTGAVVMQAGAIDSSTSVAYNGRVDLIAGYNAVPNPEFGNPNSPRQLLPFVYQSYAGNDEAGAAIANSGTVTFGPDSVLQILPETTSTDRVVGDLALPSQVEIQGGAVYLAPNATVLAPGAAAPPSKPAYGSDGTTLASGVTIRAGNWIYDNSVVLQDYEFVHTDDSQQIYLDRNSAIDVGGLQDVAASVGENLVSVQLRGSELANSPLQRDGPLRGQTVQVDLRQHGPWDPTLNGGLGGYTWVGTPLADTSGWVGLTTHSVAELSVNGGSVALQAGGAVVLQAGSTINVSGGSIDYQGGNIQTTKLGTINGHIVDISQATANQIYTGIYTGTTTTTDPKWGTTQSSSNPLSLVTYDPGYVQGGNGGSLSVSAPTMALDGALLGNTVAGKFQLTLSPVYKPSSPSDPANPSAAGVASWLLDALNLPQPSQLNLTFQRQYFRDYTSAVPSGTDFFAYSPTPPDIVFTASSALATNQPADAFDASGAYQFAALRNYELDLSPTLVSTGGSGFGVLRIDDSASNALYDVSGVNLATTTRTGAITVAKNTVLALPTGGSVSLSAGNITVGDGATVSIPGGSINLKAYDLSSNAAAEWSVLSSQSLVTSADLPAYDAAAGNLFVGQGSVLSVAGEVMDNRPAATDHGSTSTVTNGGSIALAGSNVVLSGGTVSTVGPQLAASTLDVSGGAVVSGTGKFSYGKGGSIQISSGKAVGGGFGSVLGGNLALGARLLGYAGLGQAGGSLTLQVPSISIQNLANEATVLTDPTLGTLELAPAFFNAGGFSSFNLTGLGFAVGADGQAGAAAPSFMVAAGTLVQPVVQNWQDLPGGVSYAALPGLRKPAGLTFVASDVLRDILNDSLGNDTGVVLDAHSAVTTDPLGQVTLKGDTVEVLGSITAPGGNIAIVRTGVAQATPYTPTVHFGPASSLDVSGTAVYTADANGYHASGVIDGGTISVQGSIVAEGAGAVLDARGVPVLDVAGNVEQGLGATFDVAGSDGTVQLLAGRNSVGLAVQTGLVSAEQQSSGGSLTFQADNELFIAADARLVGGAGQPAAGGVSSAHGGALTITSSAASSAPTLTDVLLDVTQQAPAFVYAGFSHGVTDLTGKVFGTSQDLGLTWFGVNNFQQGQFGALTLSTTRIGAIQVDGDVSIVASRQITLADAGELSFAPGATGSSLILQAPYIVLGHAFQPPSGTGAINTIGGQVPPTAGTGTLLVRASHLIDVGDLSVLNASSVTLDSTYLGTSGATNGSIRGDGIFDVAGAITLKAGQVYTPTETTFDIIAFDQTSAADGSIIPGSVTVLSAGALPALPLSAGGNLNIYASVIDQGGVLRAPLGSINLGAGSAGGADVLSGLSLPTTSALTLRPGSITSVSAVDPVTGQATIPFGITVNGAQWVDPAGTDITNLGPNAKNVTLTAGAIDFEAAANGLAAASIDIQGGGNLSAYQFVPGTGGTADLLSSATSGAFAVVPTFQDGVAPYGAYGSGTVAQVNLGNDPGYTIASAKLTYHVGDQIYLSAGAGLAAGNYTLLPARYALLPGAYLVTPLATNSTIGPAAGVVNPDGASVVAGYRYNGFDQAGGGAQSVFSNFEVAPQSVVLQRAQYVVSDANTFFTNQAAASGTIAPRLPQDAGQLVLEAGASLTLQGTIAAQAQKGARGGLIDISSPSNILIGSQAVIAASEASDPNSGMLLLDAAELSSFGAESLLVGGVRTTTAGATQVNVAAANLTVDNSGEALTGTDVILVANNRVTLNPGADVHAAGTLAGSVDPLAIHGTLQLQAADNDGLTLVRGGGVVTFPNGTPAGDTLTASVAYTIDGSSTVSPAGNVPALLPGDYITLTGPGQINSGIAAGASGSPITVSLGDGALLRVSSDATAQVSRSGLVSSAGVGLTVGKGATVAGAGVIVDSTYSTAIDPTAAVTGTAVALDSGQISLQLDNAGTVPPTTGLLLSGSALQTLVNGAQALSLLSYSSIDFYGSGTIGALDASGQPVLASLGLHAGAIRGYTNSSDPAVGVTLAARAITLDNSANSAGPVATGTPAGALTLNAKTINLGGNQLQIQDYASVTLNAGNGVLTGDPSKLGTKSGGLNVVGGDLTIDTPLIAGVVATNQSISADGKLALPSTSGTATVTSGFGASLALSGATVQIGTGLRLPSGTLTVEARSGDLTIAGASLDVSGGTQQFYDVTKFTDGGRISLTADTGGVTVAAGSQVSVAANVGGGNAGTLDVSAPNGSVTVAVDTLSGHAGMAGLGGTFALDASVVPGTDPAASHLQALGQALLDGGFDRSVTVRVREGDVVADGALRAHEVAIAADHGTITVNGTIDASGLSSANPQKPAVDPTGGTIDLTSSGSVVLTPTAALTAAGYCYDNAGHGGEILLSAGSFTGLVDPTASVDVQAGATIDLSVKNQFTTEDVAMNNGATPAPNTRSDLVAGTLHLRESQAAFGTGAAFDDVANNVTGASAIVLEGFQAFDLAKTDGSISTSGSVTSVGSGGLINDTVQGAVAANGTAFVNAVAAANPGLFANGLIHVQPGAEMVNTAATGSTATGQFVVLNKSALTGGNTFAVSIKPGATVTVGLSGPMPTGDALRFTAPSSTGTTCRVTYADGTTKVFNINSAIAATSTAGQPVVAFSFVNTSSKAATGQLAFTGGTAPLIFVLGAPATASTFTTSGASYVIQAGDLALASNWDLSSQRFGPNLEPGNLTLRAQSNLVFGFDASLSDGFNPANASDPKNPLWTAPVMTGASWSYQLVAGSDYSAANSLEVRSLASLPPGSGSVLVGAGGLALPTVTGSAVTSASVIPQFYQVIRTGTGDISISAGRDVQLLNPLASIYTAGTASASLADFALPGLGAGAYPASYSQGGGNVVITAQSDIVRYQQDSSGNLAAASSAELPDNWLYRRGYVDSAGNFAPLVVSDLLTTEVQSTSWWVDFSNFFDDVGALGGGNVTLAAGRNVTNVNASVPTNARMPGTDAAGNPIKPSAAALVELGGGNLAVRAGADVDGGVYYVERGDATVRAGGSIHSNSSRSIFPAGIPAANPVQWLPTAFFLGQGSIEVVANGDVLLGPVANPFLLPQGAGNQDYERTFFSTYDTSDAVNVTSFGGKITLQDNSDTTGPLLTSWYLNRLGSSLVGQGAAQPWLRMLDFGGDAAVIDPFANVATLLPSSLRVTAFSGDINLLGSVTLAPSPTGTLDLLASRNLNGMSVNGVAGSILSWGSAAINLSDASPTSLPGIATPLTFGQYFTSASTAIGLGLETLFNPVNLTLTESGDTNLTLAEKLARHGSIPVAGALEPLHYNDPGVAHLYAVDGDISGLTFYSGKKSEVVAGHDITDVGLYIQNARPDDVTTIVASHDIIAYDPNSPLRTLAGTPGNFLNFASGATGAASAAPDTGDIQIAGPGTVEVLAGRNFDLGSGSAATHDGTAVGLTSVGAVRNPYLPQNDGASIVATAGVGSVYTSGASALSLTPGLASTRLDFADFIRDFLNPATTGAQASRYLPDLATLMGVTSKDPSQIWAAFGYLPGQLVSERQALLVQDVFQLVLRDSARDRNDPTSLNFGTYTDGFAAIAAFFPGSPEPTAADLKSTVPVVRPAGPWTGEISTPTREIKTFEGGNVTLLVPGGGVTVGRATDPQTPDQGILTERGGNISMFAADSISVGTSRIFTLLGGNEIIWSTWGNIAAGSGSKTVFSAPPTRVLIDPQSGDVQNDLAGLATGAGIGVLATLSGVSPGNVDLIAPVGTIDAGDAGIRSSGNLNIAARVVLNASNIQVGGITAGTPPPPPAPNLGSLTAASSASAATSSAATDVAKQNSGAQQMTELPSLISVEVLGYGGDDENGTDAGQNPDDDKRARKPPSN